MNVQSPVILTYSVVMNTEEQYSIWPNDRELPAGWRRESVSGTREQCLDHIERIWVDMRPRHVRELPDTPLLEESPREYDEPGLVERLCAGEHSVVIDVVAEQAVDGLEKAIESGCVHVRVEGANVRTELTMRLSERVAFPETYPSDSRSRLRLVGELVVDYIPLEWVLDIQLSTLAGTGTATRRPKVRVELLTDQVVG